MALLFGLDGLSSVYSYGEDIGMESNACAPETQERAVPVADTEIQVIPQSASLADNLTADRRVVFDAVGRRLSLFVTRAEAADAYQALERAFLKEEGATLIETGSVRTGEASIALFGVITVSVLPDSAF